MKTKITACTGLLLCPQLVAQGSFTTPPGGLTKEGSGYSFFAGGWSRMRLQQADDMHRDAAATIEQMAWRLDNRSHDSSTAMGRTWSNMTLTMSEQTNFATMSRTFAANVGASPTVVFSNKWTWPTQVGTPLVRPDVWGGSKGQLRVPFTKPWVYSGKNAILADYTFKNGALANGAGFGTGFSLPDHPYYLDSAYISTDPKQGTGERLLPFPPHRCQDSAITFYPGPAVATAYSYAHGAASPTVTLRGKVEFVHYSYATAPAAPVIHALGAAGSKTGVLIGARCNRLYVDFNKPVFLLAFMTSSRGDSGKMGWVAPWNEKLASRSIWLQAAWLESKTKAFSLTTPAHVWLPDALPPREPPRHKTLYWHDTTSPTGNGPIASNGFFFPYTAYWTK